MNEPNYTGDPAEEAVEDQRRNKMRRELPMLELTTKDLIVIITSIRSCMASGRTHRGKPSWTPSDERLYQSTQKTLTKMVDFYMETGGRM